MAAALALGAASAGLSLASGIIGGIGASKQGKAQRSAMKSQRRHLKKQMGQTSEMYGMKLDQFDTQAGSFLSSQRQQFGLSGVDLEGSPLLVAAESEQNLATDRSMIELERDTALSDLQQQRKDLKKGIKTNRQSTRFNVAGSILGGMNQGAGTLAGFL